MNYYDKYLKYKGKYKELRELKELKEVYIKNADKLNEKILEEYGELKPLLIIEDIKVIIGKLIYEYNPNIELFGYKDDKIIVIVLDNIVIKIYNKLKFDNFGSLIYLLNEDKSNYLEYINEINNFKDYYIVCSRTIIPILKMEIDESYNKKILLNPLYLSKQPNDKERLLEHISLAINYLHSKGWSHEDINLDNIGYDPNSDQYRVFDFEESQILTDANQNNDFNRFRYLSELYDEYLSI